MIVNLQVEAVTEERLTFVVAAFTTGAEAGAVNIARPVPDLSFICEHNNRLFGVEGQNIWASALGEPPTCYKNPGWIPAR